MAKSNSSTETKPSTKVEVAETTWREVLTQKQQDRLAEMRQAGMEVVVLKCLVCGKYLVREKTVEAGLGDYCDTLVELGWTPEKFAEHRQGMSQSAPEDGMIKVADLHKICVTKKIPVSRMVRAIGGDRCLNGKGISQEFTPIYVKGTRWVSSYCASPDGLKQIEACKGKTGGKGKTADKLAK